MMNIRWIFGWIIMVCSVAVMAETTQRPYAQPPMDAPELAALGQYDVGTQSITVQSSIALNISDQGLGPADRAIKARIWYPAAIAGDGTTTTTTFKHALPTQDGRIIEFEIASLAIADARPVAGAKFPVVVVSHGYNGWDTFMTWLTENLASKGYIVIAPDHGDQRVSDPAQFPISFGNVLINRAADVRAVIDDLSARARDADDPLGAIADIDNIGLVGYSMGGFGSLAAAGLDYDRASPVFAQLPPPAREAIFASQAAGRDIAARVRAIVAIAPFGGRPDLRAWSDQTVAAWRKPTLIITGDHDDIVGYETGVQWLFNQMGGDARHLLIYQNARHNVGGNPPPKEVEGDFSSFEYFAEPVWRTERINAINQHFITAFLGLHLRGDQGMAPYLDARPEVAGDGQWPLAPFANVGGSYAGQDQDNYWRGFQRRWALGLEWRNGRQAGE